MIDAELLSNLLKPLNVDADILQRITETYQELVTALAEYQEMKHAIEQATPESAESVEEKYRQTLEQWYKRKIVVVPRYEATGEEIISRIVEEVPPGFHAKIMGLQNIKGTGLDFVYRFQAWDTCHEACQSLLKNNIELAQKGLNTLLGMPEIGQLCQQYVAQTIQQAQRSQILKRSDIQLQLDQLKEKLEHDTSKTQASANNNSGAEVETNQIQRMRSWILDNAEQYLDVNDSLRRRDAADLIYRELAGGRISRQRAVVELRNINKRQKGGWLKSKFSSPTAN